MNKENCALKLVDEIILYYDARSKKTSNREVGRAKDLSAPPVYRFVLWTWTLHLLPSYNFTLNILLITASFEFNRIKILIHCHSASVLKIEAIERQ